MNNKAMSMILVTLIVILLTLVALFIIYFVIYELVKNNPVPVCMTPTLDMNVSSVISNGTVCEYSPPLQLKKGMTYCWIGCDEGLAVT